MECRKTTLADIEKIILTEQLYKNFVGQWSLEQHIDALENKNIAHIIFYDDTHDFIGFAIINGLSNTNNNIELMRIAINEPNHGYGKSAIKLVLNWCFTQLKAHRVWLDVREHNKRAQKVYGDLGFIKEGLLRDCVIVDGKYQSLFVMSMLESEYISKQKL